MRRLGGSLLLGLSAATFLLSPVAEQLLRLTPARLYFIRTVPERTDYGMLLALICAFGLPVGMAHWASFWRTGLLARLLEAPLAMLCVMGISHLIQLHLARYAPLWNLVAVAWARVGVSAIAGWFVLSLLIASIAMGILSRWAWGLMVAKPLLCGGAAVVWLASASALWHPVGAPKEAQSGLAEVKPSGVIGAGNPVVWILLDEWDYDLTFSRSDNKVFPEFERLRKQSVFLDHVKAAGTSTLVAIPGLLMGQLVRDYRPASAAAASVSTEGTAASFPGPRTIFDSARRYGYRSNIVGWYHPYCRIFGAQTASCWWDDWRLQLLRPEGPLTERAGAFLRESIELESAPGLGPSNITRRQMERVQPMLERAAVEASRSGRSFSFLHLPVPHGPFFKLDAEGRMVPLLTDLKGYQSGLDAADRAIGFLRGVLEKERVWDEALVVVSSDHSYRYQLEGGYGNGHIPMMIKFPHQETGMTYGHPFQAVETKSLIEDFMQGMVSTPERAVAWMERSGPAAGAQGATKEIPVAKTSWPIR